MKLCYSFMTILVLLLVSWSAGLAQPINFERHKIANIPTSATSIRIHPADLDNDGDQDIVTADALGGELFWWESSGGNNPTFTKHQFASGLPQCGPFFTADVNGDGHLDILITSFTGDKVVWWRNDGNPDPTFIQEVLRSGFDGAIKVIATDLDQDGDVDVAAIARTAKQLRVFYNDGDLIPSWTQVLLSNSLSFVEGLAYGDFNEDGLKDLVVANSGNAKVTMFEGSNTASNGFSSSVIQNSYFSKNIYGADMNGDGNKDVLTMYEDGNIDKIGFLKNDGATNPSFSNKNVGTYDNSFSIFPVDLDGDGNLDVLGGSNWEDGFRWWHNSGGTNPSFTSHLIQKNFVMAWTAKPADMDGDGDMDFVASTGWAIHWFENDLIEPCEISITCKDPFNFPVTINGGTSVISGQDMVKDHLTEDCNSNLTYTINGQQLLDFFCEDIGPQTLTIVATDEDGNSANCSIDIQVVDLIAPSITCPDDQNVDLDANCEFQIPDYTGLATVVDNCSNTIIQTPSQGTIVDENRVMILTVVDQEGQTDNCIFFLNVVDNDGPTAVCLDKTINLGPSGTYELQDVDVLDFNQTSDCSNFFVYQIEPPFIDCIFQGTTLAVEVAVTDDNGNPSFCTANISVEDNEAPMPICNNPMVTLDANGQYTLTESDVFNGGTDNCGMVNFESASPSVVDCDDVGTMVAVTVTVNDGNGNTSTCAAQVTVEDNEDPVALCNNPTVQLDENGKYSLVEADVFNGGTDNCGTVNFKGMTPSDFDCDDAGSTISVTVTANDGNGNSSTCTAQVTVEDNEAPVVSCNNPTVEVDASGSYTLTEADVFAGGTDNCGTVTYVEVSPSKVNCSDVGNTVQVTVTGEDSNGNTSTCTADVMVKDNIQPVPTCNNTSVQLDANGQYTLTQADVYSSGTDNCGTVNFQSMNPTMVDCEDAETTVSVTVTVNDGNGNTNTCIASIMVDDNTPPVPVCTNTTITFNGEDDIAVSIDDLYDAASSSDNCGIVNLVSPTMDQIIDCDQIGNVIPVVITVNDGNGNDANCTADITVEGLPCGFANTFGLGDCYDPNGNAADYDPNTGIFTLTSDGCAPAFPYTQDDQSFIQYELCGDGVIDVYIENLDGNGYAGIVMRESTDAGARKVAISTNTINRLLKEVRVSPNYPAYPQQVFSLDKFWLRIERINGFFFKASASVDGNAYIPIINQAVQMTGCVQTGLFVYSSVDGESVTAQFSNVNISETNQNLASTENFQTESTSHNASLDIGLLPNPARDIVNLNLRSLIGEEVNIRVYDINGQLMTQVHYDEVENATEVIALDRFPSGTYYINVQTAQQQKTLKLIKQ